MPARETVWKRKQEWLRAVMASTDLSSGAKLLAWEIQNRCYGDRMDCWPGQSHIQRDLGLTSVGRLHDHRKELVTAGAIQAEIRKTTGGKKYTVYMICLGFTPSTHVLDRPTTSVLVSSTVVHGSSTDVPDIEHRGGTNNYSFKESTKTTSARTREPEGEEETIKRTAVLEEPLPECPHGRFDSDVSIPPGIAKLDLYPEWCGHLIQDMTAALLNDPEFDPNDDVRTRKRAIELLRQFDQRLVEV